MLGYLLTDHYFLWAPEHLRICIREIYCNWSTLALGKAIESKAFNRVVDEFELIDEKLDYFNELFAMIFGKADYYICSESSSFDEEEEHKFQALHH